MTYIETILGAIAGDLRVTEAPLGSFGITATPATTDPSQRLLNRDYWGSFQLHLTFNLGSIVVLPRN